MCERCMKEIVFMCERCI